MSTLAVYSTIGGEEGPFQSGNPITLQADLVEDTSPVEPATVTFNLRTANDQVTTYTWTVDEEVTNPSPGQYLCNLPTTWLPGQTYANVVTTDPDITVPGEFYVIPSSVIPPVEAPGPQMPPCTSWLAGEDLVGLLGSQGLSPVQLDAAAVAASMLAFEGLGRRFPGLCGPVTVRPCQEGGCGEGFAGWGGFGSWVWTWGYWEGSWGFGPGWGWGNQSNGRRCSCGYDSNVLLAGYPVSQVTQVKLDGNVMPTTFTDGSPTYRLDNWKYLTRLTDPDNPTVPLHWPRCQRLDLPDTSAGTWSVTYLYGAQPPPLAIEGAKQLASNLMLAMNGTACQLPANVRSAVRQGATFERITPLAEELRTGATGMFLWDAAVAAYNPYGLRRPASVFSPDTPFPVRIGNE